jgi:hypothetical protein
MIIYLVMEWMRILCCSKPMRLNLSFHDDKDRSISRYNDGKVISQKARDTGQQLARVPRPGGRLLTIWLKSLVGDGSDAQL